MEKSCLKCKLSLSLENFRIKRRCQGTKICIKCLDARKASKESTKCHHEKRRSQCKECRGGGICHHQRLRSSCKECKGSQICLHQRVRAYCKDCKGSQYCHHEKQRRYCPICDPQLSSS
ncbi:uncharacterized protein LOC130612875 [Hydractinia symbiolongicarpus]|uniref:uncharacterized protein LOC130612875 n=1 Tax=Hydractinia symbiolongicarpus TaxID=13093 RepID=UPI00254D38D7|nr:uncharacterized protein LOC130612875 [Hydractinia symbiolongicarpus]